MGPVIAAVLLVGLVIAMVMYLSQPVRYERGSGRRGGGRRERTMFGCIACVFMTGLLQVLRLPVLVVHRFKYGSGVQCFANVGSEGQHLTGNITKRTDAAIATRYLLGKIGTDIGHVAVAGAADIPYGVITDEAGAAEDPVNVFLLGAGKGTTKMIASAAITAGALLEPAASGKVATKGGGAGSHYVVGRALDAAAADGDVIEVVPLFFLQVI